jgi:hypothetical protein
MSLADTLYYQNRIHEISHKFTQDMLELFEEVPEAFEGRSTKNEWANQVWASKLDLDEKIKSQVEIVESLLHNGSYHREF